MKFNKIFSVLACAALLSGTFACTDKVEPTPSPVAGNEEVYFPYTESSEIAIPLDATHISVTVNRVDASEESTVALTSSVSYVDDTDEQNPQVVPVTDIFTIPASVTFPKDVKEITLEIGVEFEKVVIDREYSIDLTLEDGKTGSYGLSHRTFTAIYLPWGDWKLVSETEPGTYTLSLLANGYYTAAVYVRQSLTNENLSQYMIGMPTEALGLPDGTVMVFNMDKSNTVDVDGTECPLVWMSDYIDTGETQDGESIVYSTTFTWLRYYYPDQKVQAYTDEQIYQMMANNNFAVSYFDPVKGCFFLDMTMFLLNTKLSGGQYLETLQLPGDYHDYFFSFNYEGNMVTNKGVEYALVQILPSADIDHFSYDILPGALSGSALDAAYEALAEDADAELIYDASYSVSYQFEEEGKYTVIAVGYDASNNVVCKGSKTYEFTTVQAASEWQSLGYIDYTDGIFVGLLLNENGLATWEVEIQEHKETPGYYRLVNPYENWPLFEAGIGWTLLDGNYYIELDAQDPDAVLMPLSELGVDVDVAFNEAGETVGAAQAMSEPWYDIAVGDKTFEQAKADGSCGTFEDDMITFPTGGLLLLAGNGRNLFYANLDPTAPSTAPVTYGMGCFCVDFSQMSAAPAKKIGRKSVLPSTYQLKSLVNSKKQIKNAKRVSNKPSQEEIREARFKKAFRAL